jgi:hypothetical protein
MAEPELPPPARQPDALPESAGANPLPARTLPETDDGEIIFSRIVRAMAGQIIEIPFRGTGWVYLGELGNRRGLSYDSRRLDIAAGYTEGQSFIFRAEAAGTYILKFYRQDFIQDYIINDYVQVIVGEAPYPLSNTPLAGPDKPADGQGRVIAEPRWPPAPEGAAVVRPGPARRPAEDLPSQAPAAVQALPPAAPAAAPPAAPAVQPAPQVSPPAALTRPRPAADEGIVAVAPPQAAAGENRANPLADLAGAQPAEYVRRAKQEFDAGRVEPALLILDAMRQRYPSGTDEAWWLYGQLLEANSASRDVRLALEYYRRLVREYPQSGRAGDAQRRIAYLERYYFNIR